MCEIDEEVDSHENSPYICPRCGETVCSACSQEYYRNQGEGDDRHNLMVCFCGGEVRC